MTPADLQDIHLLGRVAAGDQDAFAEFFDRHSAIVLGVLTRMLKRRDEAEEILQEAFLQAWDQAARYRPERATARGWLLMLARSRALDRIRSREARARREDAVAREAASEGAAAPVGSQNLERMELRGQLSQALDLVPSEQRECIELAFYEGLSHTQIAARLGQPLGTVKSRMLLGMNKLRQTMAPYYE